MVDIETTGLNATRHAITDIGVVAFDLANLRASTCIFDLPSLTIENIGQPNSRDLSYNTMRWRQEHQMPLMVSNPACYAQEALDKLNKFVYDFGCEKNRFWSKPSHFDYPFISGYYEEQRIENPFHYREVMDLATYVKAINPNFDSYKVPFFSGEPHNALNDARHQVYLLSLAIGG